MDHQTQIGLLQIQGVREDSVALRLRLSNLLNTADLRPAGLPPSAILVVRRMIDPLPGRLSPRRDIVRVDAGWERAVQTSLADKYHQASRPVRGYVPSSADAVLFADESEMLACLALDMSRGTVWERWWWKEILRNLSLPAISSSVWLQALLCERAHCLPAVLHHLAEWGQVASVVINLSPEQAMTVLSAMSRAYAVADFSAHISEPETRAYRDEALQPDQPSEARVPAYFSTPMAKAPWDRWLPSAYVPQGLGKERECLTGVGLTIYHMPGLTQSRAFHQAVRGWWKRQDALPIRSKASRSRPEFKPSPGTDRRGQPAGKPEDTPEEMPRSSQQPLSAEEGEPGDESPLAGITQEPQSAAERETVAEVETREFAGGKGPPKPPEQPIGVEEAGLHDGPPQYAEQSSSEQGDLREPREAHGSVRPDVPESTEDLRQDEPERTKQETGKTDIESAGEYTQEPPFVESCEDMEAEQSTASYLGAWIETQLAGVLYLINMMESLHLPACFQEDWEIASQVGSWGVLELLGRSLLVKHGEHLTGDPIWRALAELDGREPGELPAQSFRCGDSFRLPSDWLTQVGMGPDHVWCWATDGQRLRVRPEGGYLLVDIPRDEATPQAQAAAEIRDYLGGTELCELVQKAFHQAPVAESGSSLLRDLDTHLVLWLSMILPYIRLWLQQRLNLDDAAELEETLLLYPGRLYVTSSHVDLVMSLNDISMAVRLAGLDRDPGWLPHFGRVVLFHFE